MTSFLVSKVALLAVLFSNAMTCPDVAGGVIREYIPGRCIYVRQTPFTNRAEAENQCNGLGSITYNPQTSPPWFWTRYYSQQMYNVPTDGPQTQLNPVPITQTYSWHLPKLDTKEKNDKMIAAVQFATSKITWTMWIGLRRNDPTEMEKAIRNLWANPSKWLWTSDYTTLQSGSFNSWGPNEPNNKGFVAKELENTERCVISNGFGSWNDLKCDLAGNQPFAEGLLLVCESAALNASSTPNTTSDDEKRHKEKEQSQFQEGSFKWDSLLLIGIAVGNALLVVLICAAFIGGFCYLKKRRQKKPNENVSFSLNSAPDAHCDPPQPYFKSLNNTKKNGNESVNYL